MSIPTETSKMGTAACVQVVYHQQKVTPQRPCNGEITTNNLPHLHEVYTLRGLRGGHKRRRIYSINNPVRDEGATEEKLTWSPHDYSGNLLHCCGKSPCLLPRLLSPCRICADPAGSDSNTERTVLNHYVTRCLSACVV